MYAFFIPFPSKMSAINNNSNNNNNINISPVTLLIGISCTIFDTYQHIPLTLSPEFIRNLLRETPDEGMKQLSRHICTHALCVIYDDLVISRNHARIRLLVQKAQLFHNHGRTARDIIFPSQNDDPHAHHGNVIYVCTHC